MKLNHSPTAGCHPASLVNHLKSWKFNSIFHLSSSFWKFHLPHFEESIFPHLPSLLLLILNCKTFQFPPDKNLSRTLLSMPVLFFQKQISNAANDNDLNSHCYDCQLSCPRWWVQETLINWTGNGKLKDCATKVKTWLSPAGLESSVLLSWPPLNIHCKQCKTMCVTSKQVLRTV